MFSKSRWRAVRDALAVASEDDGVRWLKDLRARMIRRAVAFSALVCLGVSSAVVLLAGGSHGDSLENRLAKGSHSLPVESVELQLLALEAMGIDPAVAPPDVAKNAMRAVVRSRLSTVAQWVRRGLEHPDPHVRQSAATLYRHVDPSWQADPATRELVEANARGSE